MFCSKTCFNLIKKVYYRALCALYFLYNLSSEQIIQKHGGLTIHLKHLQILMTEVFKSLNKQNPQFMWNLFDRKNINYSLRSQNLLKLPCTKTITYGLNSILFRSCILWNSLPSEFKNCQSLQDFKHKIKSWDGKQCTCKNCR